MHIPNSHCHSCVDVDIDTCSYLSMPRAVGKGLDSDSMASRGCSEVR